MGTQGTLLPSLQPSLYGVVRIGRGRTRKGKKLRIIGDNDKMQMLETSMYKKYSAQRFFGIQDTYGLRYITPLECERCMNVPDGYTDCISNTARYKALGNGWEVNFDQICIVP
jgi:site-specific DNA-cytosine methylase